MTWTKRMNKLEPFIRHILMEVPDMKIRYLSYIGAVENHGIFKFRWDDRMKLHIELTDEGYEYLTTEYDLYLTYDKFDRPHHIEVDPDSVPGKRGMVSLQWELMEPVFCNSGWDYYELDTGIPCLFDFGIADDGEMDVKAGDVTWDFEDYIFYFWIEKILLFGEAIFHPYVYHMNYHTRFMDWKKL